MCNYSFPDHISLSASSKSFISKLLQKDPKHRLTIDEILNDGFFSNPIPDALPTTLLACPPNKIFLDKYSLPNNLDLKHRDSTESSLGPQKTERGL
jgi:serine/threonine protein kinase